MSLRPELVICDVDGCLSRDKGFAYDLPRLAELRAFLVDRQLPFALGTGRPDPYVEALSQALDLSTPSLCEHGCYLYDPALGHAVPNPALTTDLQTRMRDLRRLVLDNADDLDCFIETKLTCLSVHPRDQGPSRPLALDLLARRLDDLLTRQAPADWLRVNPSACCIDMVPAVCDKGSGALALCNRLGLSPDRTMAIGDSEIDLPMMAVCGLSACPSGAREAVKARVAYVASSPDIAGVLEILHHFVG